MDIKETIASLIQETDTPERIDLFNSIIKQFENIPQGTTSGGDWEDKYNTLMTEHSGLQERYRTTFLEGLKPSTETINPTISTTQVPSPAQLVEQQNNTKFSDIFMEVT